MAETPDRIESLFAAAVSLAPDERGAYLERECSGDPALRDRLAALLRAHDRAGHVIDRPVDADPDQTAGYAPTSEERGTIIAGRYKLLEEIGQGGMGTVWAAEQTTPVRRKVALKLIKAGMDSRSVLARFEAERQALALMDHPNIAKVLDGGLTESGRPYFVMEYVKGVPITEYCDATRLSVEERLNLFIQVCSALQHAHQKGIIHRDLKPSNILVAPYDDKPVPKVIDFGLAKAMHQSLTEKTLYTAHETVLGTPLYMSPEQAQLNNLDVDTRADIYSLGVLLYELLTGTTPIERQRFKAAAWDEIRRMIREEEPPRPSMRLSSTDTLPSLATFRHTEPAKLKKLVRGELDWIVMKALEKDRTRRYETANGLARDIQRYLDDEVVEARPPSTGYRIGKFVRRHKAQVIAAGLVVLALLAGIAGTTWGLIREARAKTRLAASLIREQKANADLSAANEKVQERYDLAVDAIKTFHTGVSEDFLLKEEKFKDLRNRLLKSAADFYGKLGALLGKETDLASRRSLAASNFELAELTSKVGDREAALAAHRAALAAREALAAEPGTEAGLEVDVSRSLLAIAWVLGETGKTDEALAAFRRSESLLAGRAGSDPAVRAALAYCRSSHGVLLRGNGRNAEALAVWRLARADQERLAAAPGASCAARSDLADTLNRLGVVLMSMGNTAEAEAEYRKALGIRRELAQAEPTFTGFRNSLAMIHNNLGILLKETGKTKEAEAEYRAAIAIRRKLVADEPAVAAFSSALANGHNGLGNVLASMGKATEAEAEYRQALTIFRKLVDADPAAGYRESLAMIQNNLGDLKAQVNRLENAEAEYRAAIAIRRKLAADERAAPRFRSALANGHYNLSVLLTRMGRAAEAEVECRAALAIARTLVDDSPAVTDFQSRLAVAHSHLGALLVGAGRVPDAEAEYRAAIAILRRLAEASPAVTDIRQYLATGRSNLGNLLAGAGRLPEAEAEHRAAIGILQGLVEAHPHVVEFRRDLASGRSNLGTLLAGARRSSEAEAEYRAAIAILQGMAGAGSQVTELHSDLARIHRALGAVLSQSGRPGEAEAEQRKALALRRELADRNPGLALDRDDLAGGYTDLADAHRALGRAAEARDGYDRAVAIREAVVREISEGADSPKYRSHLAGSLRRRGLARRALGDATGASTDALRALALLDALPSRAADEWYETACCHAALAGPDPAEADRAMDLLRRAAAMGFRDIHALRTEAALDPLRDRDDLRLMMMELAFPADPFDR